MLRTYEYDGLGVTGNRLDRCPFCGHSFETHEFRPDHFLDHHDPEDAGLTPLGTVPEDHDAPLFQPVDALPGGEARAD